MRTIEKLTKEHFASFVDIAGNAYPVFGFNTTEHKKKVVESVADTQENDPFTTFYGVFEAGNLLGGMRLHDYTMNVFGHPIPTGGVGMVCVDLIHKKQHVAKDIIQFFLREYRQKGAPFAILYPFRPDFYKRMGFGYGTQKHCFRVRPGDLPAGDAPGRVAITEDKAAVEQCYDRVFRATHGLIKTEERGIARLFRSEENRVAAYFDGDEIKGYLVLASEGTVDGNPMRQNMLIKQLIYEDRVALAGLLGFLRKQADQVDRMVFYTQDEFFYHVPTDPRDGSDGMIPSAYHVSNTSGVGLMYRVVDVPTAFKLLKGRNFGGQDCKLKITIADNFLPENAGSTVVHFKAGQADIQDGDDFDVEIQLDVSDFSSLLLGIIDFKHLYTYNQAEISDPDYLDCVQNLFYSQVKPVCITDF
ncbi:MAG: GNAT family N-acetyltransferase [Anaerolineales bacterium]|nr:GNAT family N-acetyltransferase [Anaerolineales bacterium]